MGALRLTSSRTLDDLCDDGRSAWAVSLRHHHGKPHE